jgi:DNA-binding NarL/FixJ family response regulator
LTLGARPPWLEERPPSRRRATRPAQRGRVRPTSILGAIQAGARGYLTRDAGAQVIERAIETVQAGETLLEPRVQARPSSRSYATARGYPRA